LRAVFDTNILVDFLNGISGASEEISGCESPSISIVTWIEVLVGCRSVEETRNARALLARFDVQQVPESIAQRAVEVRQQSRLKLPDAIVLATAMDAGCLLVTRNTKDYAASDPLVRVPYTL
jgi:predicted nucleic acid-binding protein